MIPLRIRVETPPAPPFVARLRLDATRVGGDAVASAPHDLFLVSADGGLSRFSGAATDLTVVGLDPAEVDGDVLLVDPRRGMADRLIRARSPHNTLLVTERCDQACIMCSQPPKEHHADLFPFFTEAIGLAPAGATIGISGGEPTLYKQQLFSLLKDAQSRRPDIRFHVLTNGQHFSGDDLETLSALDQRRILWGIPLYADDPGTHDAIVVKDGAHAALLAKLALLARAGCAIELRTVLLQANVGRLPALARYIATNVPFVQRWAIMQLENIGYGRMNWGSQFFDHSTAFDHIGIAVDIARSRGLTVELYNFPLCTVPPAYRDHAPRTISDWKQTYLPVCETCDLKDRCSGFFAWHPKGTTYQRLGYA